MKAVAVIMAGGKGTRFWPKSRDALPKQFISLSENGRTMIQLTCDRLHGVVEFKDIFVVTNQRYEGLVREQLPNIPAENILLEPCARNTAPCIGLAAAVIQKRYGDAVIVVLASDHLIQQESLYRRMLKKGICVAETTRSLVTLGITPTHPETGYGYIQYEMDPLANTNEEAYIVKQFVEKPNLETAKEYLRNGNYLWNSGMFLFCASSILAHYQQYLPTMYAELMALQETVDTPVFMQTLEQKFALLESVSIDYGIMEKSDDIVTIPGSFGWDDVGSWNALERIQGIDSQANVAAGDIVLIGSENCIVQGGSRLIALVGMHNTVVVDAGDVILVCDKESTSQIREVIERLKADDRQDVL